MKRFFSALFLSAGLLLLAGSPLSAQETKKKIGILPVKYQTESEKDAAGQITNLLYDNFTNTKRATIINREFFDDLKNEKFLTSDIDFIDGETYSKTKSLGAKFLLVAKTATCKVERKETAGTDGNGHATKTISYECFLNVGLRLIDVETGQTVNSYTLENNTNQWPVISLWGVSNTADTPAGAIKNGVINLRKSLSKFLNLYFPIEAEVVRIDEVSGRNKDKAESIVVALGSNDGVAEKDVFLVKEKSMDGEDAFYKEIGEIRIEEVNGPGRSTGKVTKGDKDILLRLNAGAKLVVVSKT